MEVATQLSTSSLDSLSRICPAVCTQQTYVTLALVGLIFAVAIVVIFFLRKRFKPWVYLLIQILLLFIFVQTFIADSRHVSCGSGCSANGVYYDFVIWK